MKSLALILGAGASQEVNLPVGEKLKGQIAECLDIRYDDVGQKVSGDNAITNALKTIAAKADGGRGHIGSLLEVCWHIRDAMPQSISIDNFIDSHRDNPYIALCSKLAIARCILEAEANSALAIDRRNIYNKLNFSGVAHTWFNAFFQLLHENCDVNQFAERIKSVAIISFNYDRCIEHYLNHAVQNYYKVTADDAAKILDGLEIHHPYGHVGALPRRGVNGGIDYGATPNVHQLLDLSKQLRTFTEGTDPATSDVNAIRRTVLEARRVAFLGFAFHRINVDLLFPGGSAASATRGQMRFATAVGLSHNNCEAISDEISVKTGQPGSRTVMRSDKECSQLFREYQRMLSLN